MDFLVKQVAKYIPKTAQKARSILNRLEKRKKNNIFTELLTLPEGINAETGKFCVVIFDEFHNLENMEVKNIYSEWAKLLMLQKNTMYVIISSLIFKTKVVLSRNLSLLFGNFEVITVEPFDIGAREAYLEERLEGLGLKKGEKDFVVSFSGGYPFYLDLICGALRHSSGIPLAETLENLIFEPAGILNQRFSNYLKRFQGLPYSRDYLEILYLVADGHTKIKDIAEILRKPKKELNLRVNYLLEWDALSRSAEFLKINDRVFGFWLRFVYKERLNSLTFDAVNQRELFKEKISGLIQEFLKSSSQPVAERICELLRLFEDEMIQIDRKKIRLDAFREIKPIEFRNRSLKDGLLGRSRGSLWIMGLKYEPLTEKDVIEFSQECKKYRSKTQRKIILAFQDIDANAKLRAFEEKILTWDLNHLNQILDLFSRPRVIL
jgi:hypothetical protein